MVLPYCSMTGRRQLVGSLLVALAFTGHGQHSTDTVQSFSDVRFSFNCDEANLSELHRLRISLNIR